MAEVVVAIAIQKLGDFMTKMLGNYLTGVLDSRDELLSDVEWLRDELEYMESFLEDADGKQEADNRVHRWISDIHTIAQETTSVLNTFTRELDSAPKNGCLGIVRYYTCTFNNSSVIFDINQQIDSLKIRTEQLSRRRETYGIRNISGDDGERSSASAEIRELRRTTSFADTKKPYVGLEDVKHQLLQVLLEEDPQQRMISIYGMGGLGKTTLARCLYTSSEIISHFPMRAWICVSQDYNNADLLRSIIKSFKKECNRYDLKDLMQMNVGDLERHLYEVLKDKKYLVVVDDVWTRKAWQSLERVFPDCDNGSRVILTTRETDVATRIDGRVHIHNLRFLNSTEIWELFKRKFSFRQEEQWSPNMLGLGQEMVAKCGGLPLAVAVLGGLLAPKHTLEEWNVVKDHLWRHLAGDAIEISHLLSLTYDCLSRKLRQCFLYLGIFPEDYLIDTEELMYLWMGEQFIPPGEEMEDVAESYLNELINRGLIQVEERLWEKTVKCRIHDLLRDLAIQKALSKGLFGLYNPHRQQHSSFAQQRRHIFHTKINRYTKSPIYLSRRVKTIVIINPDRKQHDMKMTDLCVLSFLWNIRQFVCA